MDVSARAAGPGNTHRKAARDSRSGRAERQHQTRKRSPQGTHQAPGGKPQRAGNGNSQAIKTATARRNDVYFAGVGAERESSSFARVNSVCASESVFASTDSRR